MKPKNRQILTFLVLTFIVSSIFNYIIIKNGSIHSAGGIFVIGVMWTPGISAVLTLLLCKQSLKTVLWRLGKPRYLILAYIIPLLYVSAAYIPFWLTGSFDIEKQLTLQSIIIPLFGAFVNIITTLGEEIGWRGFLFPQLEKSMSFRKASLLTGLIWSVWHIPALLMTDYGGGVTWYIGIPFFIITLTAISLPMAYLCKRAKSIWPAVLFHAVHNAFLQAFYDPFTVDTKLTRFLLGETGLILAVASLVLLFIFLKIGNAKSEISRCG